MYDRGQLLVWTSSRRTRGDRPLGTRGSRSGRREPAQRVESYDNASCAPLDSRHPTVFARTAVPVALVGHQREIACHAIHVGGRACPTAASSP
jgi:hypothetical protein